MDDDNRRASFSEVLVFIGVLSNIINIIDLIDRVLSNISGKPDGAPDRKPFYLPVDLEPETYAWISGLMVFFGLVALGLYILTELAKRPNSVMSLIFGGGLTHLLFVIALNFIFWLAFRRIIETEIGMGKYGSLGILVIGMWVITGVVSFAIYNAWFKPRLKP